MTQMELEVGCCEERCVTATSLSFSGSRLAYTAAKLFDEGKRDKEG